MNFTGKTAVVTGGSRGLGRAVCLELAAGGSGSHIRFSCCLHSSPCFAFNSLQVRDNSRNSQMRMLPKTTNPITPIIQRTNFNKIVSINE